MEIFIENLLKSGIVVGIEYFPVCDRVDYHELCISLLLIRLVFIWK